MKSTISNSASANSAFTEESPWRIIQSYFEGRCLGRLVRHQIESYNNFIMNQAEKTINMFNPVRIKSPKDFDVNSGQYAIELFVTFDRFQIYRPQIHENNGAIKIMFPQEARLRNFTYSATTTVDVNIHCIVRTGDNLENKHNVYKTIPNVQLGKIPIMVKSDACVLNQHKHMNTDNNGECKYDAGGYLIINGSEKTVLCQERAAENKVYCFNVSKTAPKYLWTSEVKSIPSHICISPKQISVHILSKNNGFGYPIHVQFPRIKTTIPLFVLFRALGVLADKNICEYILLDVKNKSSEHMLSLLVASITESSGILCQTDAIKKIMSHVSFTSPQNIGEEAGFKMKWDFTLDILSNDLFPHCFNMEQKRYFLGHMVRRVLCASITKVTDDRDSYANKRIDTTGVLVNNLYRNYVNKVVKEMETHTIHELNNGSWRSSESYNDIMTHANICKIINSSIIENGLKRALSTGDFGLKQGVNSNKVGVAQVLNRLTYCSTLSHHRRISTPTKSGKHILPRKLSGTSWGFVCPVETPEGHSVGIVKNMSYLTNITLSSNHLPLLDYMTPFIKMLDCINSPIETFGKVKVFLNGAWIGIANDPVHMYTSLKQMKYSGIINIYVSIVFDIINMEIRLCSEAGRLTRPLLRVKNNKIIFNSTMETELLHGRATWDDLLTNTKFSESAMEYIDPEEQQYSLIAMFPSDLNDTTRTFTHCEIHPSTILGVVASCIPFSNHNQSPRNTYQSAMAKQSMGIYVTNFTERMDKTAQLLNYPARPLVDTRIMSLLKLHEIPSGYNVTVAIMSNTGFNQEDSILMNEASIARGLFQATIYHTEKDEDKHKMNGNEEIRCKPNKLKTRGIKFANYEKVNANGLVPENTSIEHSDVIIAKVVPIKENRNDHTQVVKYEDHSKVYRTNEMGYIDKNYLHKNGDGYNFAKTRIRATRRPTIGDKFSSRHGQKGTVGNIIPEQDMPFMANGLRPDIIINPHAIPSRMTIGQLTETLLGKVLISLGLYGDGTTFASLDIDTISKHMTKCGYESSGEELMYNGKTGEQMEYSIFVAPVFYQRLKHMVIDKQHVRSSGRTVNLTHQPAEGRSRNGGLKFGEMERDCMISHGASRFTQGRMMDASDKYEVNVCNTCGLIASYNDEYHIHHCRMCDNNTNFSLVKIPYSCKLLFQELQTMNVSPRIITDAILRNMSNVEESGEDVNNYNCEVTC